MNLDILPLLIFLGAVFSVTCTLLTEFQEMEEEIRTYEDEDMR